MKDLPEVQVRGQQVLSDQLLLLSNREKFNAIEGWYVAKGMI